MEDSNHWYGHTRILADYCGMPAGVPPRVWAALQHGWNIEHGFGNNHWPYPGFPRLVWSDVAVRRGQSRGWREYVVIGAPWNYLLQQYDPPPDASERSGTIFYPFHTWEYGVIEGEHADLIEEIKATEDGPVTACLYWIEFEDEGVRRVYEEAGFRVICHGTRGATRHTANTGFLHSQYAELTQHRRVISNRLTTAVLYGISAGCEAGVYGDPMVYSENSDLQDSLSLVERMYPEMHAARIDAEVARDFARTELGLDRMAAPAELRELLGWGDL